MSVDLTRIATRREAGSQLNACGVTGAAMDAALKESGAYRHALRQQKAWEQALGASRAIGGRESLSLAGLLLVLESAGTGGRDGVQGLGTLRHPAFVGLGKGRRNASDGPAWTAAINAAAGMNVHWIEPLDSAWGVRLKHWDDTAAVPLQPLIDDGWGRWMMTVAREGLRVALGMEAWIQPPLPLAIAPPAKWAGIVNALEVPDNSDDDMLLEDR